MGFPTVSIITPSFNQAQFLPATLRSIRDQDYPQIEHIVIDGGSIDGSLEILRAAPAIRWISEPDRGQVDALNKGFALATGDVLAWLNSDDLFETDTVRQAVAALERTGADAVYGDLQIVDPDGGFRRWFRGVPFNLRMLLYGINYIGQQTVFFRRDLLQRAGPLREEFDNGFDYELWLRFARHGRWAYAPEIRGRVRVHPAAKSVAARQRTWTDSARIRREYWSDGGLPWWCGRSPWRRLGEWFYRGRRQWRIFLSAIHQPTLAGKARLRVG